MEKDTNIEETEVEEDMAENSVSKNVEREKPDVSEQPLLYKKIPLHSLDTCE